MGNTDSYANNQLRNSSRLEFVPHFYVKSRAKKIFKKCQAYPPNQTDTNLYLYNDNSVFIGTLQDGLRHGFGSQFWYNGEHFSGKFENDLFHGDGRFLFLDQSLYNGQWQNGKQNGQGILITANGGKFIGNWVNNRLTDDQGTYKWLNGWSFVGKFINGQQVDKGYLIYKDKIIYECEKIVFNSGYLTESQINDFKKHQFQDRTFLNYQNLKSSRLVINDTINIQQSKFLNQYNIQKFMFFFPF